MSKRKKVVVITGAGVSQESGLSTFRDKGGLWDMHDIRRVATIEALHNNLEEVLEFYNYRRIKVMEAQPNKAHLLIAKLEEKYDVVVITQNVDDLHERAGSSRVIHLHGLITLNKCTCPRPHIYPITPETTLLKKGMVCEKGSQLRHNIVLFGEPVENLSEAAYELTTADIIIVIGTSLMVVPAADLILELPSPAKTKIYIDPAGDIIPPGYNHIPEKATSGMEKVYNDLMNAA